MNAATKSWKKRLLDSSGHVVGVVGALVLLACLRSPSTWNIPALWLLALLLILLISRSGTAALFGPVMYYEVIRSTRRYRVTLMRTVFAGAVLFFLCVAQSKFQEREYQTAFAWNPSKGSVFLSPQQSLQMRYAAQTRMNQEFFYAFLAVQLGAVILLTPAMASGCIAEEKDRGSLEFLLATDLSNHEIVLGKAMASLAQLGLLTLTGLPILSLLQLLGGVDPQLMISGYVITLVIGLSVAGVSVLCSVYTNKAFQALLLSYGIVFLYALLLFCSLYVFHSRSAKATIIFHITAEDIARWVNEGNVIVHYIEITASLRRGASLDSLLPTVVGKIVATHLLIAGICFLWAVGRMRSLALADNSGKARRAPRVIRRWVGVPNKWVMHWKEILAEPGLSFNWFGKLTIAIIAFVSIIPPILIGIEAWKDPVTGDRFKSRLNDWVGTTGTTIAMLTLIVVLVRAARSIRVEYEKQSMEGLLTSPLTEREILFAKFLGSILCVRWAWIWMGVVWLIALVGGGLDVVQMPWLILAWTVYAASFAVLGLYYSFSARSSTHAILGSITACALLMMGHWLIYAGYSLILGNELHREEYLDMALLFHVFALTPPFTLSWLAFAGFRADHDILWIFLFVVSGMGLYILSAFFVYRLLRRKRLRMPFSTRRRERTVP